MLVERLVELDDPEEMADGGEHALADMVAREGVCLEEGDGDALTREGSGSVGACGAAADDEDGGGGGDGRVCGDWDGHSVSLVCCWLRW